jgi:drug/metabolite transporter (DMT)-like permease
MSKVDAHETIPLTASLLLVLVCFLWGGNMVSIKISNQGIPPLLAATIRSGVASVLLWAYARGKGERVFLGGRDLRHGAAIGTLFALDFLFLYWGMAFTHASRGILFLYMHPFWVALGAHFLLPDDRLTVAKGGGLVLAFAGLLSVFGSRSVTLGPRFWVGDLMELAAAVFWAGTTLYIKKVVGNRDFTHYQTLFAQLFFSMPILGAAWLLFERGEPLTLSTLVLGALGYQCIVVAFFSYLLWFWMIHRFPVSRLTAFTFLAPMFGVILSGLVLKEPIPLLLWVGLVLVGAGIYLVNRPPKWLGKARIQRVVLELDRGKCFRILQALSHQLGQWYGPPNRRGLSVLEMRKKGDTNMWFKDQIADALAGGTVNDAVAYGVEVQPVQVEKGQRYWKVIKVYHLSPVENHANHNVYVDLLDEDGNRVYGAKARATWQGGQGEVTIDKPENEPGTNLPLWKHQVVAIEGVGLPSDKVLNLHSGHPDEPGPPAWGNTLFHHSFYVAFQRTIKEGGEPPRENSVIQGTVTNGAGMTIVLSSGGQTVASKVIGADGRYRFANLPAGSFTVAVSGTDVSQANIRTDGTNVVTVNLTVVPEQPTKPLAFYILFGSPDAPGTRTNLILAHNYVLKVGALCGFSVDEATNAQRALIVGDTSAVSAEDEAKLVAAGCQVSRLSGDSYAVERAFADLMGQG